jgi:hypothetical protein
VNFPRRASNNLVFIEGLVTGQSAEKTCARIAWAGEFMEKMSIPDGSISVAAKRDGLVVKTFRFAKLADAIIAARPFKNLMFRLGVLDQHQRNLAIWQRAMSRHQEVLDSPFYDLLNEDFVKQAIESCSDKPRLVLHAHNREISQMVSLSQGH